MKSKLIASAPSKEELEKVINEFYTSTNCIITDDNRVYNTKLERYMGSGKAFIEVTKNRWRYRMK